ncbi:phage tail tape measure protein [Kingella kingae]|uniref:phage tail tape measure protein n=1 Tax=Kingella kingae TaxID=504 RepID=UPI00254C520D|nr:phage tail tape measure protein [Kingella kingae]MDK4613313.1 phage tail tape measure protein [Kingella kingae]
MTKLETASQKASMNQQNLRDQSQRLSFELRKAGVNTQHFATEQVRLHDAAAKTTAQLARQREALIKIENARSSAQKMMLMSAGAKGVGWLAKDNAVSMATSLQGSVTSAMSEEDAMQGVIRQVGSLKNADGSLNHAEIAKMRQEIQALSSELPMATVEIIKMYAAGAKMNVPHEELRGYVTEAVKAANAFESDNPEKLAEELGRIRANFQLSKQAASELVNVLNYLDDNALVSGDQLIDYMNRVSGSMGLAKMSERHVAALGSALMSAGTEASTAAQAVGSLMTRLATAPETKEVRNAIKAIGLNARVVQKGMVTDAQGTLEKIVAAVKKMPKEQQAGILKGLAGGEYNRVFAGLIANTEAWNEQIKFATSQEALGSLDKEFAIRVEAMSAKWDMFKNKFFNAQSGFGRGLFDGLQYGIDILGGLLERYNAWAAQNPQQAAMLSKIAAGAVLLMGAVAGLSLAFSAVLLPIAGAKFLWASLFASMSGGTGIFTAIGGGIRIVSTALLGFGHVAKAFLVSNPFGWAILAVSLLAALYLNWEKVKNAIAAGWAWLRGILRDNPLIGAFAGPIGMIASLIANFDRLIAKVQAAKHAIAHSSFGQAATGVWNKVKSVAGFSRGGYTGAGGVNEAAGIVHKGEVVFSQRDVARFGGWQMVERLRQGGANLLAKMGGSSSLNMGAMAVRAAEKLGGIFSGSENKPSVLPRPTVFAPPQMAEMGSLHMGGDNITIHIHATPNQDPRSIADLVLQKLQQRDQAKRRRANSSFMDKD